ncbi:MAG: tRNA (adenosine(37)-N6)-dimethylallyltransferase MiaA [Chloroflexi bacterium]|nr:tRNA (adenosine(37)-N6)-dimethylallyltransferase MiaA [Chloroflexota bacterium]
MKSYNGLAAAIVGPTGTGKTSVSLCLNDYFPVEIISCDSTQLYRGLDIATAKIKPEEMRGIRHHMIDIIEPDSDYTLADYQEAVFRLLPEIWDRGSLPVFVGGTGLYLKAVDKGFELPYAPPDFEFRKRCSEKAEKEGALSLHNELLSVDPESASRLNVNDTRRITRALEVYRFTGRPLSDFYSPPEVHPLGLKMLKIGITMERKTLYSILEKRVEEQVASGLLSEVEGLIEKGLRDALSRRRIFGYSQVLDYLEGRMTWDEAVEDFKKANRNYAKRQLTWFGRDEEITWFRREDFEDEAVLVAAVAGKIRDFIDDCRAGKDAV